jgi:hypothetical protein
MEQRLREGMPLAEAVVDAGAVRFRPMLLTAMAVVVGKAREGCTAHVLIEKLHPVEVAFIYHLFDSLERVIDEKNDAFGFDIRLHGNRNLQARNNLFDADLAIDVGTADAVAEVLKEQSAEIDVTEAEVVISGGRGLKGPENFALLRELMQPRLVREEHGGFRRREKSREQDAQARAGHQRPVIGYEFREGPHVSRAAFGMRGSSRELLSTRQIFSPVTRMTLIERGLARQAFSDPPPRAG